jgi:hypothetical protein
VIFAPDMRNHSLYPSPQEHPWSADGREMLKETLKRLGRLTESAAVEGGNELLEEGACGGHVVRL